MIRFVDLGHQLNVNASEGLRYFAWYDTVCDHFLDFDGEQTFNTWSEFEPACPCDLVERLRCLFPAMWNPGVECT
jgi:hypothetical protein